MQAYSGYILWKKNRLTLWKNGLVLESAAMTGTLRMKINGFVH